MSKKTKKILIISVIIISFMIIWVLIRPMIAHNYNDYRLSKIEEEIVKNFPLDRELIKNQKSKIYGNEYFMIGNSKNTRKAECHFSITLDLEGITKEEMLSVQESYKNRLWNSYEIRGYENKLYFYKTPYFIYLGNHTTYAEKGDSMGKAWLPFFSPIPLYDERCKTMILFNGA